MVINNKVFLLNESFKLDPHIKTYITFERKHFLFILYRYVFQINNTVVLALMVSSRICREFYDISDDL